MRVSDTPRGVSPTFTPRGTTPTLPRSASPTLPRASSPVLRRHASNSLSRQRSTSKKEVLKDHSNCTHTRDKEIIKEMKKELTRAPSKKSSMTPRGKRDQGLSLVSSISCMEVRFMLNVGDKMWLAQRDGSISIYTSQGEEIHNTQIPGHFCWCLCYCEDMVWAGYSDGYIRLYDPNTLFLVRSLHQHAGGVYCLAYSNGYVYSGSNDFECFRWHAKTYEFLLQYYGHTNAVRCCLAYGSKLITGSDDHTIRVWDILSGNNLTMLQGHRSGVLDIIRDGDKLWSASDDGTIMVWDIEKLVHVHTITDHSGRVATLIRAGDRVLSAGIDRILVSHNVDTFRLGGRTVAHEGYINHVACLGSFTRYTMWTCSADKSIRVWHLDGPFRSSSSGDYNASNDAVPLNRALEAKCASLEETIKTMAKQHQAELSQARSGMESLEQGVLRREQTIHSNVAEMESLRNDLAKAASTVDGLQVQIKDLQLQLRNKDTQIGSQRTDYEVRIRKKDDNISAKDRELLVIKADLAKKEEELQQCRDFLVRKDQAMSDAQQKAGTFNSMINGAHKSIADLNIEKDTLRMELLNMEKGMKAVKDDAKAMEDELAATTKEMEMLRAKLRLEQKVNEDTKRELAETEKMAKDLYEQIYNLDAEVKKKDASLTLAKQDTQNMQERMDEAEKQIDESRRKEADCEFVISSRSELVRQIWDLFCQVRTATDMLRDLHRDGQNNEEYKNDVAVCLTAMDAAKAMNKTIVANYFTHVEKLHLGTSPYYFPADPNHFKYRVQLPDYTVQARSPRAESQPLILQRSHRASISRDSSHRGSLSATNAPSSRRSDVPEGVVIPRLGLSKLSPGASNTDVSQSSINDTSINSDASAVINCIMNGPPVMANGSNGAGTIIRSTSGMSLSGRKSPQLTPRTNSGAKVGESPRFRTGLVKESPRAGSGSIRKSAATTQDRSGTQDRWRI